MTQELDKLEAEIQKRSKEESMRMMDVFMKTQQTYFEAHLKSENDRLQMQAERYREETDRAMRALTQERRRSDDLELQLVSTRKSMEALNKKISELETMQTLPLGGLVAVEYDEPDQHEIEKKCKEERADIIQKLSTGVRRVLEILPNEDLSTNVNLLQSVFRQIPEIVEFIDEFSAERAKEMRGSNAKQIIMQEIHHNNSVTANY